MSRYTPEIIEKIWQKATIVNGYDPEKYRKDNCDAWICRDDYNNHNSDFGWEIDHIYPQSLLERANVPQELIDSTDNLRAMNWRNNESKADDYPVYHACVSSEDNKNMIIDADYRIAETIQERIKNLYEEYVSEL
uniref:hypothetical protein n=1 Tax=Candidatus Cryptobacteroides bacterium TaxID=3085639 RepID=UPI0040276CEC